MRSVISVPGLWISTVSLTPMFFFMVMTKTVISSSCKKFVMLKVYLVNVDVKGDNVYTKRKVTRHWNTFVVYYAVILVVWTNVWLKE